MQKYIKINKFVGETPLQALERAREKFQLPKDIPIAYAGRLDPMASGTLLLLLGEECKKQKKYHAFDKKYSFSIVFGIHSDTHDVLGRIHTLQSKQLHINEYTINKTVCKCKGTLALPYPHFSSKTVSGKPLHTWALEGKIHTIKIPIKESMVHQIKTSAIYTVPGSYIYQQAIKAIKSLPPVIDPKKAIGRDFRRKEILNDWKEFLKTNKQVEFYVADIVCIASSGTYMRSLANHIAERLDSKGIALSIHRTKIGTYKKIFNNVGMWTRTL